MWSSPLRSSRPSSIEGLMRELCFAKKYQNAAGIPRGSVETWHDITKEGYAKVNMEGTLSSNCRSNSNALNISACLSFYFRFMIRHTRDRRHLLASTVRLISLLFLVIVETESCPRQRSIAPCSIVDLFGSVVAKNGCIDRISSWVWPVSLKLNATKLRERNSYISPPICADFIDNTDVICYLPKGPYGRKTRNVPAFFLVYVWNNLPGVLLILVTKSAWNLPWTNNSMH